MITTITDEEQVKVRDVLQSRGVKPECTLCGGHHAINNELVALPLNGALNMPTQRVCPCVMTYCQKCGHARFHAIGAIGLSDLVKA